MTPLPAALALAVIAAAGACVRPPDAISPRIAYHQGDDGGSAQSIALGADWDMGSRKAVREATLTRLSELSRQQASGATEVARLATALSEAEATNADLTAQLSEHHEEGPLDATNVTLGTLLVGALVEMLRQRKKNA